MFGFGNKHRFAVLALALLTGPLALAQSWPSRPITVIVPSGPGGMDTLVRLIIPQLTSDLGQPIVVDNKPGANGILGVNMLKASRPDGYTVLFATMSILAVNPFIIKQLPYDTMGDLEPIARHAMFPFIWVSNPGRKFASLKDMLRYAKDNPGQLKMGHPGVGSFGYLLEEALVRANKIDALLVPFRSAPQATTGTLGGVVDVSIDNASSLSGFIENGQLSGLAVTTADPTESLPGIESWVGQGAGAFPASAWYSFVAPKGTPEAVLQRLNQAINRALAAPEVRERIKTLGGQFDPLTVEQTRQFVSSELHKYQQVVKSIGLQPE